MFRTHKLLCAILLAAIIFVPTFQAAASMHNVLTYQGLLTDSVGNPLNSTVSLTFNIYNDSTTPTSIWTESHTPVVVTGGLFTVNLGQTQPLNSSIFDGSPKYLGITVDTDPEITPRALMGSSPHALSVSGFSSGPDNLITGKYSTAGGDSNQVLSDYSGVASGLKNIAEVQNFADTIFDTTGIFNPTMKWNFDRNASSALATPGPSFVGGGAANAALGSASGILAGSDNTTFAAFSGIVAGCFNYTGGRFDVIGAGLRNSTSNNSGFNAIGGGIGNNINGYIDFIGSGYRNVIDSASNGCVIGGGFLNYTNNHVTTIGGGIFNRAVSFGATIGGGQRHYAIGRFSTIGGGDRDSAVADFATIGGGALNYTTGPYSTIGGGNSNRIDDYASTIAGGERNYCNTHPYQFIGGGLNNIATNPYATIGGGLDNIAATWATVGGGVGNLSQNEYTFIGGGRGNDANGYGDAIGGGIENRAINRATTIGGGEFNGTVGTHSTVGGGFANFATGDTSIIGGGTSNSASAANATVAGGQKNSAAGISASVGGGSGNNASGIFSTIPGGLQNAATGPNSFAAGFYAKAVDTCSFVWSDCCRIPGTTIPASMLSSGTNSWTTRATGGYYLLTSCDTIFDPSTGVGTGVYVPAGGAAWLTASHSSYKDNIEEVDGSLVLDKLSQLDIKRWNYKSQDESIVHISPLAEDFYKLFNVGDNDHTISTIDPSGIALAAIKELHKKTTELEKQSDRINDLESKIARLEEMMATISDK